MTIKVGGQFVPISIAVLENDNMDFLFGLDMLRRYRCVRPDASPRTWGISGACILGMQRVKYVARCALSSEQSVDQLI